MNDQTTTTENNENSIPDEVTVLKARADQMGITYHPSIGVEKLREKVQEALAAGNTTPEVTEDVEDTQTPEQARRAKKKDAEKLIRIRITCMNPMKREWDSELFSAGNSLVGGYTKLVPFDTPWCVPNIIYKQIRDRQCQIFYTTKDSRGNKARRGKMIKEFAIEVLPDLTEDELKDLAQRQAMANGTAE